MSTEEKWVEVFIKDVQDDNRPLRQRAFSWRDGFVEVDRGEVHLDLRKVPLETVFEWNGDLFEQIQIAWEKRRNESEAKKRSKLTDELSNLWRKTKPFCLEGN